MLKLAGKPRVTGVLKTFTEKSYDIVYLCFGYLWRIHYEGAGWLVGDSNGCFVFNISLQT